MADRYERIRIFEETMNMCRNNHILTKQIDHSKAGQMIVWQEEVLPAPGQRYCHPEALILSNRRSLEAARKYADRGTRVCVLNFASSVTPGGGVTQGATAQEESMCRVSTLYVAINDEDSARPFYERHRQMIHIGRMGRENRDDCIYTPDVMVLREDTLECKLLPENEWYNVDVITCAAPDLRYDEFGNTYRPTDDALTHVFEQRWRRILTVAALHKAEYLILGAFGCGAFHNPPGIVVQAFNNIWHEFLHVFYTVEFAVYSKDEDSLNYKAFRSIRGIKEDVNCS